MIGVGIVDEFGCCVCNETIGKWIQPTLAVFIKFGPSLGYFIVTCFGHVSTFPCVYVISDQ
jgi:hypothetical protein